MDLVFLGLAEVLEIHRDQLLRYGGASGIRDINLLKSSLAMPSATYSGEFLHTDVYEMAASYLFYLVKNHPFIDGNKQVGAVAAFVFLALNGHDFEPQEDDFAEMVLAVARGEITKAEVAVFIRRWSRGSKGSRAVNREP